LSRELIKAQEDERQRIARELHDNVAQELSMVRMSLEGLAEPAGGCATRLPPWPATSPPAWARPSPPCATCPTISCRRRWSSSAWPRRHSGCARSSPRATAWRCASLPTAWSRCAAASRPGSISTASCRRR
jgi:hypothetical protein